MAIVQISRIQIRRGLQQDLPQLASAEMGWSLDTQKLYIGNGTTAEGAPTTGVTEILTQHSNILSLLGLYTYQGAAAGYTVVTGPDSAHPVTRTFQNKLDDSVSVRDFGAVGNGIADDTAAINRALQQIYSTIYNDNSTKVRRTLNFPAGSYLVTSPILLPPYATITGDGRQNSILVSSNTSAPIMTTTDSQFNGTGSTLSRDIAIQNLGFQQTGNASLITSAALVINGTRNARIFNVAFRGNTTTGATTNNLVYITDSVQGARNITLESCSFSYAASGVNIVVQGSGISAVRIDNSYFDYLSNVAYFASNTVNGITTLNNYYGNVTTIRSIGVNGNLTSLGGTTYSTGPTGVIVGRQQVGVSSIVPVATGAATILTPLSTGAGSFDYQFDNGSSYRFGTFKYTNTGSAVTFEDDYTETGTSLGANLFCDMTGNLSISTTTAATLKYNLKQYI
jgi:Pectate lyase superfamily protein/Major tropism determinant N-terminal domain